ncbi:MAG: hypothetical protein ACR2FO_00850 [Actinomycetota bacterium]
MKVEFDTDLTARVGARAASKDFGDLLFSALERRVKTGVVSQDAQAETVSAAFCIDAANAEGAIAAATQVFRECLAAAGGPSRPELTEITVALTKLKPSAQTA